MARRNGRSLSGKEEPAADTVIIDPVEVQQKQIDEQVKRNRERAAAQQAAPPEFSGDLVQPKKRLFKRNTWEQDLRKDILKNSDKYMHSLLLTDMKRAATQKDVDKRYEELHGKHKAYATMTMLSMLMPLRNGVSVSSVAETVGMGTTLWMFYPEFRTQTKAYLKDAKTAITDMAKRHRKEKLSNKRNKLEEKIEKREEKGKNIPRFLQRRYNRIVKKQNNGRVPFTERSAALTFVGLTESAYKQMRQEGVDPQQVQEAYDQLVDRFWSDVQKDGLMIEDVQNSIRQLSATLVDKNPAYGTIFKQTAHGELDTAKVSTFDPVSGERVYKSTGEFVNADGDRVDRGVLTLRAPNTTKEHIDKMLNSMTNEMYNACKSGSVERVEQSVIGYAVTAGLGRSFKADEFDGPLKDTLIRGERMRTAMDMDMYTRQDQQNMYEAAFMQSLDKLVENVPVMDKHFREKYGDNWRNNMYNLVHNPEKTLQEWQDYGVDYSAAPESVSSQRYRQYDTARDNQEINIQKSNFGRGEDYELNDQAVDGYEMGSGKYDNSQPEM